MRLPRIDGLIERRLLVNYGVEPEAAARLLPAPFRPQLVNGRAVAGICLIRMSQVRPTGLPSWVGRTSENAAHRVAVEWDTPEGVRTGVFIPRRDTGSALNAALGGRLFPGAHERSEFTIRETPETVAVGFRSRDGRASASASVRVTGTLEGSRLFADLDAASAFFEQGCHGWSPAASGGAVDGMRLDTHAWAVQAATPLSVSSSFFEDASLFPPGSAVLDSALLMRQVPVTWTTLPQLAAPGLRAADPRAAESATR